MNQRPRQVDRVLAALRHHPNGITETMFQPPHVFDGLLPIRRVAARVAELRTEGYDIRTTREPNGQARYRLHEQQNQERRAA